VAFQENKFTETEFLQFSLATQDIITFGGNWALFGRRRNDAGAGLATVAGRA
jgi:hypothetical protein